MKIAFNGIPQLFELLYANPSFISKIDCIKVPVSKEQCRMLDSKQSLMYFTSTSPLPIIFHGFGGIDVSIANKDFQKHVNCDQVNYILELTQSPHLSFHSYGKNQNREEAKKIMTDNIMFLKENFPQMRLLLENHDANVSGGYTIDFYTEPEFLKEIIYGNDIYFLLDISHAYTTAKYRGERVEDYLKNLPLDRIKEIHFNGWVEKGNLISSHSICTEKGYEILEDVLKKCKPDVLTIEYGQENDVHGFGVPCFTNQKDNVRINNEIVKQIMDIREFLKKRNYI